MTTAFLDLLIEPFAECMTPTAAQKIVALRADAQTQQIIDDLADKANQGTLTPVEQAEYDQYLAAFHFVTVMQARARRLLSS